MPKTGRPCLDCSISLSSGESPSCFAVRAAARPIGLVSVMPQAWRTMTPLLWKRLIMIGGEAAPPIATRFRLVKDLA